MSKNIKAALAAKASENTQRHKDSNYDNEFDIGRQHKMIRIDLIVPNPYQPRKTFSEEGISSLAMSISSEGLIQPITVRAIGDTFELIAGERRLRAHQQLNRNSIEAIVITADDASAATMALVENLKREDLTDYEAAEAIRVLLEKFPNKSQLSETLSIARTDFYRYLSYSKLPEFIRSALEAKPDLLSRRGSEEIVKFIKDQENSEISQQVLRQVWSQLEAGSIQQVNMLPLLNKKMTPKTSYEKKALVPIMKAGKKVGSFWSDDDELVLKLAVESLTKSKVEQLQNFVTALVELAE